MDVVIFYVIVGVLMFIFMVCMMIWFFGMNRFWWEGLVVLFFMFIGGLVFILLYVLIGIFLGFEFLFLIGVLVGMIIVVSLVCRGFL